MSEVDWRSSGSVARSSSVASSSGSRREPSSSDAPAQRRGLVPQNDSFLSLADVSPNPPSRRTSFVQQQKEAIERMSAMENANGPHAAKAPGTKSISRGTRLGNQIGKLRANLDPTTSSVEGGVAASPGTAHTGASIKSGARRATSQTPEAATRDTDEEVKYNTALRPTAPNASYENAVLPLRNAEAVRHLRARDSVMMESSESSSSSSAAGPSSSASTDASASMTAYSAASAVPGIQTSASTLAAMQAASGPSQSPTTPIDVAAARKKYRISGLQYIRNDATAGSHSRRVGSRDSAQRSPRIDRDTIDSVPASARTVRKMSSAQLLALRQEELLAEVAAATANPTYSTAPAPAEADRSGSTDGGTSAANMWQRKRASVADMLAGLETSVQSEGQGTASREPTRRKEWGTAMDNDSKSSLGMETALAEGSERPRTAKRELFLPQLNGLALIGDDIIGQGLSPARAEQGAPSVQIERPRNGSDGTAGYTTSVDALVSSAEDTILTGHMKTGPGPAERTSLASTVVPGAAADATPRPSRDGSAHFPDADEQTPQLAQAATLVEHARYPGADQAAQTLPLQVVRTRQRQLSDATIAELGALPGVEPAALLNENGQPLSSKKILTIALQKAQSAVLLDSSNNVAEAMLAYRQAVRLLQEVMERVAPRTSSRSRRSNREEERRRLKVIHDTYAERIRLLSMLSSPDADHNDDLAGKERQTERAEDQSVSAATGLGIRNGSSISRDDYLYSNKGGSGTYPTIAISSADASEPAVRHRRGSTSHEVVFTSAQQHKDAPSHHRQSLRTYLDDFTSSATHTPATPYFDIDPELGDEDTTEEFGDPAAKSSQQVLPSRTAFAPAQGDVAGRRKLVRRRSSSPKAARAAATAMGASASLQGQAPDPGSACTSTGSATLGVQQRRLSTESETSFRQLASRAQAASLLPATPTSGTRYSPGMPSPSFDLTSPPVGVPGSRRRASTLVGRSISPTESKKLLVSSSTATGTISQRRKHSLATANAGAEGANATAAVKSGRGVSPTARSKSPLSAGDSTYKKSTEATVQEQPQRAVARDATGKNKSPVSMDLPHTPDSAPGSAGFRKRAMSQPSGHRRPTIPVEGMPQMDAAHVSKAGDGAGVDREPGRNRLPRKASMPLTPQMYGFSSADDKMARTVNSGQGPSPIYSTHSSSQPHKKSPHASSVTRLSDGSVPPPISDMFPAILPSMQMGFAPSFASCAAPATMMWLNVMSVVPESTPHLLPAPGEVVLRPYHTMRQLCTSIECGAWLTPRLYVPREVWYMPTSRVQAMDTKSRMLELLIAGIEAVASTGAYLQQNPDIQPPGLFAINTTRFVKQLEELDMLCMDVQNSLTRKLNYIDAASAVLPPSSIGNHAHAISVRKGGSGLSALSSKLTRGLDRMVAQSKSNSGTGSAAGSAEGTAAYADALARVCKRADQVLGEHTSMLLDAQQKFIRDQRGIHHDAYISGRGQSSDDPVNGYSKVSHDVRAAADVRLRRASDFFSNVVLRFALRDVAILLDKSLKRSATALAE